MHTRSSLRSSSRRLSGWLLFGVLACSGSRPAARDVVPPARPQPTKEAQNAAKDVKVRDPAKVIVFVWDGLRPDAVTAQATPNLFRLRERGVHFDDHHAAYPTFTMMNAAAMATGAYAGAHGFYGNTEYSPGASGTNAEGTPVQFSQPVFTEDYAILRSLDDQERARGGALLATPTLFEAAHAAGLKTAAVGKTGPAYLNDYRFDERSSVLLDENIAAPYEFARRLQQRGLALPSNTIRFPYAGGQAPSLRADNGNPTGALGTKLILLRDGVTPDPRAASGSPHNARNDYLMRAFLEVALPDYQPQLSLIWLRNPDSTEHQFGPGTPNYYDALAAQDALLGRLLERLAELGWGERTNLLVVSDHGHSTVGGSTSSFPLRRLKGGAEGRAELGAVDAAGYAVSGEVRSAELLTLAGFQHVYDGQGCVRSPVLSGLRADGSAVHPLRTDKTGKVCSTKGERYSTGNYRVPTPLPEDAIVIAANGGSEYFYVTDHSRARLEKLVIFLQEHSVYGPIFVHGRYGKVAGTFPLAKIHLESPRALPPTPDLVVSFDWDDATVFGGNAGAPGSIYASALGLRGMHGSFSPVDVHATMIAAGPAFKIGAANLYPSGNVDLAPTVATLLGIPFRAPHGRVLSEAFRGQDPRSLVGYGGEATTSARIARVCAPDDPPCARPGPAATYRASLIQTTVAHGVDQPGHTYFRQGKATRE